jgi:oligoendopeptidase F
MKSRRTRRVSGWAELVMRGLLTSMALPSLTHQAPALEVMTYDIEAPDRAESVSGAVEVEIEERYSACEIQERRDAMEQTRAMVAQEQTWDLRPFYRDWADWDAAFQTLEQQRHQQWPSLKQPQAGEWTPARTLSLLNAYMAVQRSITKVYVYAHLRHDEDLSAAEPKANYEKAQLLSTQFQEATSWLEPALLGLPESQWNQLVASPELKPFAFWLQKLALARPHVLSPNEERLLAMASLPLSGAQRTFSALQNVDFDYGEIEDGQGVKRPLTQGLFGLYLRDSDRTLRHNAFQRTYEVLGNHIHSLSELLSTEMQGQVFSARARHYSSVLESALQPQKIPTSVYTELLKAVHESFPLLHRYMELRKEILGVADLQPYDLHVPLVADLKLDIPYEQAVEWVVESVAPLGPDYQKVVKEGLTTGRWVDPYENKGKRSGAYSSGCYDSQPYVLMNYRGSLTDVFTLAHEVGHSMHSWLSNHHNTFWDSRYPIFVAEVASTFNEQLLFDLLLKKLTSPAERLYLINQKVEEIRTTLYRQAQFAEFELWLHEQVETGVPLTSQAMNAKYAELNRRYYGPALSDSPPLHQEWARIPHFYFCYYVYQYATGLSSAIALHDKVVNGDESARNHYLEFLKAGGSQFPLQLLEEAGVSLARGEAVRDALTHFKHLLDQMEALLRSQKQHLATASI